MSKRQVVSRDDYELYSIKMPFLLRKKQRESFIARQLEKMHPRFSTACSVDSKIGLSKKGLTASVAVMDTVTLAKYKSKTSSRLFLEGNKKRTVFSMHNSFLYSFTVCFALTLLFFLSYFVFNSVKKKPAVIVPQIEHYESEPLEKDFSLFAFSSVLEKIKVNSGIVSSLCVEQNKMSLEVRNCFPEQILSSDVGIEPSVSELVYRQDEPMFSLSWKRTYFTEPKPLENASVLSQQLRNSLKEKSFIPQSELINAVGMTLYVDEKDFSLCMNSLSEFCLENKLDFKMLSCKKENSQVNLSFELVHSETELTIHSLVAANSHLFVPQKKNEIPSLYVSPQRNFIGSVLQKDGHLVQFYLDEDGKIKGVYK
ncbi:MAG TPA: hypothetical protein DCQ43_08270 [Treponema sp.]|nr:hypothetical protein [Treponema sp.]